MEIRFYDVPVEGKGKVTSHGKTALKFTFPCGDVRLVKRAKLAALLDALDGTPTSIEVEACAWNAIRDPGAFSWRSGAWGQLRLEWTNGSRTFVTATNEGVDARFRFKDLRRAVETA